MPDLSPVRPVFAEAFDRGPEWRRLLEGGVSRLPAIPRDTLRSLDLPIGPDAAR